MFGLDSIKKQWPFWIWVVIFIGMFIVGFLGVTEKYFWHYWEYAALGSTVLYATLFYLLGFFFRRKVFMTLKDGKDIGLAIPCMLGAVGFLGYASYVSYSNGNCNEQLIFIVAGSICFLLLSLIMTRRSNDQAVREDFKTSLILNDMPVAVAFGLLLAYSYRFHVIYAGEPLTDKSPPTELQIRAFIGGAIAFQMILSNWIFADIFRKPGFEFPRTAATAEGAATTTEDERHEETGY
jgi:hypothetical protein